LRNDTGKAYPPASVLLLLAPRLILFQGMMNLSRPLVEEEQATRHQNDIPPRNGMAEQFEQWPGEADDPGDRGKQREAGNQRQSQSDLACPLLLFCRQPPREDRDKNDVVDAEHDLEGGQC